MLSEKDPLDVLQYRIFRWVLFVLFLAAAYRLLDQDLHIGQYLAGVLNWYL